MRDKKSSLNAIVDPSGQLRKMTKSEPILTLKLNHLSIDSQIGRDWRIEITPQGFGAGTKKVTKGSKNVWLLQTKWDTKNPQAVKVSIDATEKDKFSDTFGPAIFDINVDSALPPNDRGNSSGTPSGHNEGRKVIHFDVAGQGGDVGKKATINLYFDWFVSSDIADVTSYISSEFTANLKTEEFKCLDRICGDPDSTIGALSRIITVVWEDWQPKIELALPYMYFRKLVGTDKQWDHKPEIKAKCGEWLFDKDMGKIYRFDIFSNVHYGYIGRAAGFSEEELLEGAGLAQLLHDLKETPLDEVQWRKIVAEFRIHNLKSYDQEEDQTAIKVGFRLWNSNKSRPPSPDEILERIRNVKKWKSAKKDAPEGRPPVR